MLTLEQYVPYSQWPEIFFIIIAFQLFSIIYHYERPRKPHRTKNEWETSASDLCY
jgi:hypothetical protein